MTVAFRPMLARDERFVVSTWAMSYRDSPYAGMLPFTDWHRVMRPVIMATLRRPSVQTFVAHETDDPDPVADLYGFIAADLSEANPLVLYVYVKQVYRRSGIARRLCSAIGVDPGLPFRYAYRTTAADELAEARKIPYAKWDAIPTRNYEPRRAG